MNNLKKFQTEAEYNAATLSYPNVSWVTSGDTVHYAKTAPTPTVNDKVMMAAYDGAGEALFTFFNCGASTSGDITSIIFDDVEVNPITCQTTSDVVASQPHLAKYALNTTTVGDWFSGDLGCGAASSPTKLDILYPSQITTIYNFPSNVVNMVVEATTPPYVEGLGSAFEGDGIYVPDESVNAYKVANGWNESVSKIFPLSQYSGNLPV